jgi:DNA-binding NarL/FixJ family response regulator
MVAFAQNATRIGWQTGFLVILPKIHQCVGRAFRHLRGDERNEAVQEALGNACAAFARLAAKGSLSRAFPTVLARFAVAQVRSGRRLGSASNTRDVLSKHAQWKKHFVVDRLDQWRDLVLHDHRTPVPDQVCFLLDFPEWLASLSNRDRQIAQSLAMGDSTAAVARRFSISAARVSQLRRELHASWLRFHRQKTPAINVSAA